MNDERKRVREKEREPVLEGIGYDYASLSPAIDSVIAIKQNDSTIRKLGKKLLIFQYQSH